LDAWAGLSGLAALAASEALAASDCVRSFESVIHIIFKMLKIL
jgi:hypothetical protein